MYNQLQVWIDPKVYQCSIPGFHTVVHKRPWDLSLQSHFPKTLTEVFPHDTPEVNASAVIILILLESRGGIDVACVPEEVVRHHLHHVGGKVPDVSAIINDAHQVVSTREQGAGGEGLKFSYNKI